MVPDAKPSNFRSVWKNDETVTSNLLAHVHDLGLRIREPRQDAVLPSRPSAFSVLWDPISEPTVRSEIPRTFGVAIARVR